MKIKTLLKNIALPGAIVCGCCLSSKAGELISNGGFESGFGSWTRADQIGSEGTFFLQTGTLSPVNGLTIPSPPEGSRAAMTDAQGPGSHVLYQDFTVPNGLSGATIGFSLFIDNTANAFFTPAPASLDFATPALNQQARVDIMMSGADPFSVATADVLQNLYQTSPGNPLTSGYNGLVFNISALLQAHEGQTLRLRFAEVDNVNIFNLGVDAVSITTPGTVPDGSSPLVMMTPILLLIFHSVSRRKSPCHYPHLT